MKKTCLHGVKWEEKCRECEVIYIEQRLTWLCEDMEKLIKQIETLNRNDS